MIVSFTTNHFPPGKSEFTSSHGTRVIVAEFSDGNPIPKDAYQAAKNAASEVIELSKNHSTKRLLFCCDYGQSRSVIMATYALYVALIRIIDSSPESIPDWAELSPYQRLIGIAAHVNSSRIGGFPSYEVWNGMLNGIIRDDTIAQAHKTDLDTLRLLAGEHAASINTIFVYSRVCAHRLLQSISTGSPMLTDSIGRLPPPRDAEIKR